MSMHKRYLLIGASAAGIGTLIKLRQIEPEALITCVTDQKELPYNKCLLADYVTGQIEAERLSIYNKSDKNLTFIFGKKAIAIDSAQKTVALDDGTVLTYDCLFLGMGSSAWVPPISGIENAGVFTFHTLADAQAILAYAKKNRVKNAVIIGAGLSGLEATDALAKHNLSISIIEKSDQVLPALLTAQAADFLVRIIQNNNVNVCLNTYVQEILAHANGQVSHVTLNNGTLFAADMVIVATGMRPNIQLAQDVGIAMSEHGIVVNEYMQTSVPDIYAGGDLIQVTDQVSGKPMRSCMWPDAMNQGMHAAFAMAGKPKAYPGPCIIAASGFFGLKFAHAGSNKGDILQEQGADFYHEFWVQEGWLAGFQVLGTRHNLGQLRRMLLTKSNEFSI